MAHGPLWVALAAFVSLLLACAYFDRIEAEEDCLGWRLSPFPSYAELSNHNASALVAAPEAQLLIAMACAEGELERAASALQQWGDVSDIGADASLAVVSPTFPPVLRGLVLERASGLFSHVQLVRYRPCTPSVVLLRLAREAHAVGYEGLLLLGPETLALTPGWADALLRLLLDSPDEWWVRSAPLPGHRRRRDERVAPALYRVGDPEALAFLYWAFRGGRPPPRGGEGPIRSAHADLLDWCPSTGIIAAHVGETSLLAERAAKGLGPRETVAAFPAAVLAG